MRRIIQESYQQRQGPLDAQPRVLHKMAEALLEREILDGAEIDGIIRDAVVATV